MSPLDAAICARIAYETAGGAIAARFGYSYAPVASRDHFAWIGRKRDLTVVAFRGSIFAGREARGSISNLSTDLIRWGGEGRVHEGYYQGLWQLLGAVQRELRGRAGELVLTGHSMGAALATLAATLLEADRVHAFASPRLGNRAFAESYPRAIRVTRYVNRCDVLARMPIYGEVQGSNPPFRERYCHIGRPVRLPGLGHSMSAYIEGLRLHRRGLRSHPSTEQGE
ncbi:MAG: hypothetical protein CMN55_14065 [Sneathiella sp.]|jgi:hypothetical protein|uniref:lipase family protein n=1 Tax=Sneathiella sp. TaxID=1964365 RepID=UPI000C5F2778|nr:lipase family protein [Sneathiella sp.]MAL80208.1 hypothetical protein [Sneathiella sp.]|tara:strand:+ start:145 stop:822 length:678 start_codon:yes stop_codon:yes gene_type:complete